MNAVCAKKLFNVAWYAIAETNLSPNKPVDNKDADQLMSILNRAYKAAERQGRLDFLRITFLLHDLIEKK